MKKKLSSVKEFVKKHKCELLVGTGVVALAVEMHSGKSLETLQTLKEHFPSEVHV